MLLPVMAVSGPRSLGRWLAILAVLVLVALLRAERGVAELQGRTEEPSRILRLSPERDGDWTVSVLGLEGRIPARVLILDNGRPLLAGSPAWDPHRLAAMLWSQAERIGKALP